MSFTDRLLPVFVIPERHSSGDTVDDHDVHIQLYIIARSADIHRVWLFSFQYHNILHLLALLIMENFDQSLVLFLLLARDYLSPRFFTKFP